MDLICVSHSEMSPSPLNANQILKDREAAGSPAHAIQVIKTTRKILSLGVNFLNYLDSALPARQEREKYDEGEAETWMSVNSGMTKL